jgi:predicted transcriptional regulator
MKINGAEVPEDQIDEWVAEAEAGYDVEMLRKGGRKPVGDGPGRVVPVRLDATLLAQLDGRAEHDHQSRSEIIRAAIRAYVA